MPHIPARSNRVDPWPFDAEAYRQRNCVERFVGKLKWFRRVATRYDKLQTTYAAFVQLACVMIMNR